MTAGHLPHGPENNALMLSSPSRLKDGSKDTLKFKVHFLHSTVKYVFFCLLSSSNAELEDLDVVRTVRPGHCRCIDVRLLFQIV